MSVTDLLMDGLNNPAPAARVEMLRVLATLEETLALSRLRSMVKTEIDPQVLDVLKWAGGVIWRAQQNGYSTASAVHKHFRHDLVLSEEEKQEAKKLADFQRKLDAELMKERQEAQARTAGTSLALGALGTVVGGASVGASIIMTGASSLANNPDSGLAERPQIGSEAILPQRPTEADISVWVRRLKDPDAKNRRAALTELGSMNNPSALPHIAAVFATDYDPQVKEVAQRTAKVIYFNWYEWEVEQASRPATTTLTAPSSQAEITAILARAQAAKDAKKRKTQH